MQTAQDFQDAFASEVGSDLAKLVQPPEVLRWVNRGQSRLGLFLPKVATVTWSAGAVAVAVPADFHHAERLKFTSGCDEPYEWFGNTLLFTGDNVAAGSAKLYYWAFYPKVTGTVDSQLPDEGDDACISYCLYRFYKRLASSRADYRQYATITAQNGVDISELDALSERHFNDFDDARQELQQSVHAPSFFYGN